MYATLGDVRFQFLNSFNNLETTHKADYAEHAVLKGRPRLQATGNALTTMRFGVHLHWMLGDVDKALEGLVAAKESQQAQALVYGSGRFVGWFVINSITERTLLQDGQGRTAARDVDVELTEFVGDPNNPLPTPGISGGVNPLMAMLPESVRGTVSKVADAVQTGVRIYRAAERGISEMGDVFDAARSLNSNPAQMLGVLGDALRIGGETAASLGVLPEIADWFGDLAGAAEFAEQAGQAARQMSEAVAILENGIAGGSVGDWFDSAVDAAEAAGTSLNAGAQAVQTLTAWFAMRKEA